MAAINQSENGQYFIWCGKNAVMVEYEQIGVDRRGRSETSENGRSIPPVHGDNGMATERNETIPGDKE